ncbi:MAG: prolyl oligopeptidase family serine peptidase [Verrucomicrobia bacterium]|nr:prolyl oligopeptidase family serine peptidase [Verrucomicrobiota bacterium]
MRFLLTGIICVLTGFNTLPWTASAAEILSLSAKEITLTNGLFLRVGGRAGRAAVHTDPVEALIVAGKWKAPVEGESFATPDGTNQTWQKFTVGQESSGGREGARSGYLYWAVVSPSEQVMILHASGHNVAYVNGEIRAGDGYGSGYMRLPVLLRQGTNDFLFQSGRDALKVKLVAPTSPLMIDTADSTLPDIVRGEKEALWGAVMVLNATTHPVTASLRAAGNRAAAQLTTLPPLSTRKAPFLFYPPRADKTNVCTVMVEAVDRNTSSIRAESLIGLRIRQKDQTYKRTFRSSIEDSVQYYAVNPPPAGFNEKPHPALFLSVHGAGVEAMGQADAYSPKTWGVLVAPTNRRPYGFDWEEWGRTDAMEVLALAKERYQPDPSRIYLTGHSMGGHGTWYLGALYPDQFAAIGPSAGWISFSSYASRGQAAPTNAIQQLLRRSGASSDTLLMATNYLQEGVYILHGDADDNVPVTQAREMRRVLGEFHRDFDFHEQPGAGHWWDASDEPGADCVDWAPMFDFFARHVIPADEAVRRVRFVTVNPVVSHRSHWVNILAQERQLQPSYVDLRCDPGIRRIVGTTTNVSRLCLELPSIRPGAPMTIELDGQKLEKVPVPTIPCVMGEQVFVPAVCVSKQGGRWALGDCPPDSMKNPTRSGPFREAFRNHMVFVYGTRGTPEENQWSLARARYDAEAFWYRGNGSVDVMSDTDYLKNSKTQDRKTEHRSPKAEARGSRPIPLAERNVILFGNADLNAAWPVLLSGSPVQVRRNSVKVGQRELTGDNLACLFLQPSPRDSRALVGVVAGTGMPGLRLTERLNYFMSGGGFPDCLVIGTEMLTRGAEGLRAVGFFGQDWQVESGEFAWRD